METCIECIERREANFRFLGAGHAALPMISKVRTRESDEANMVRLLREGKTKFILREVQ